MGLREHRVGITIELDVTPRWWEQVLGRQKHVATVLNTINASAGGTQFGLGYDVRTKRFLVWLIADKGLELDAFETLREKILDALDAIAKVPT